MIMYSQKRRMFRVRLALSCLFEVGSVATIFFAGLFFLVDLVAQPALVVEEPNRVLCDLVPQQDYDIVFRVHNRSDRRVRIIGMGIS